MARDALVLRPHAGRPVKAEVLAARLLCFGGVRVMVILSARSFLPIAAQCQRLVSQLESDASLDGAVDTAARLVALVTGRPLEAVERWALSEQELSDLFALVRQAGKSFADLYVQGRAAADPNKEV